MWCVRETEIANEKMFEVYKKTGDGTKTNVKVKTIEEAEKIAGIKNRKEEKNGKIH